VTDKPDDPTDESIKDLAKQTEQLAKDTEQVISNFRMSTAAIVIWLTGILEYDLERCIKYKIRRPISGALSNELFGSYRPLSTFSAKIDMAYALEIISDETRIELHKMRNIRNKIAHARKLLSFDQEPMRRMFYELRRPNVDGKTYLAVFTMCGTIIDDELEDFLVSMGETDDVDRALKRKADKAK
jgi:hypothetical protein